MKTRLAVVAAGAWLLAASVPAIAHHSFAAEFDASKPVQLTGTVTKIEWMNPHAYFYIDVKDASGKVETWGLEMGSPNGLMRQGWTRNSLKTGETVTVEGYLAKDGKPLADGSMHANSRLITTADGRKVFVGSSADDAATK